MTDRKHVWVARVVSTVVPLMIFAILWSIPIRKSDHYFPYGHVHNLLEGVGAVLSYAAAFTAVGAGVIFLCYALSASCKYLFYACQGNVAQAKYEWKQMWW